MVDGGGGGEEEEVWGHPQDWEEGCGQGGGCGREGGAAGGSYPDQAGGTIPFYGRQGGLSGGRIDRCEL